jgi:hypothetical protein
MATIFSFSYSPFLHPNTLLCAIVNAERQIVNHLSQELIPSEHRCQPRFFLLGILIYKGLTARHLYKQFGYKVLISIQSPVCYIYDV